MIIFTLDALAYPVKDEQTSFGARQPIPDTRRLWHSLYQQYHGKMILLVAGKTTNEVMIDWTKMEGFKYASIDLIPKTEPEAVRDRVRDLNAVFGKIDWFVDTNPKTVKLVMEDAVPCLMPCLPGFVRPEWRDGRTKDRPVWDDLVREIEVQSLYRASKESQ